MLDVVPTRGSEHRMLNMLVYMDSWRRIAYVLISLRHCKLVVDRNQSINRVLTATNARRVT